VSSVTSVGHYHEPCKSGWTNHDAAWDVDLRRTKEQICHAKGQFWEDDIGIFLQGGAPFPVDLVSGFAHMLSTTFWLAGSRSSWVLHSIFAMKNLPLQCGLSSKFFNHLATVVASTMYTQHLTGSEEIQYLTILIILHNDIFWLKIAVDNTAWMQVLNGCCYVMCHMSNLTFRQTTAIFWSQQNLVISQNHLWQ